MVICQFNHSITVLPNILHPSNNAVNTRRQNQTNVCMYVHIVDYYNLLLHQKNTAHHWSLPSQKFQTRGTVIAFVDDY